MKNHHPEVLVKWDNSQLQETKTLRNWKTKSEQKTILNQQYHWRKSKNTKIAFMPEGQAKNSTEDVVPVIQ